MQVWEAGVRGVRMKTGTKKNRVKGTCVSSCKEDSRKQQCEASSCIPSAGPSAMAGPARKSSFSLGGPYAQQNFSYCGEKGKADVGQWPVVSGTATKPVVSVM